MFTGVCLFLLFKVSGEGRYTKIRGIKLNCYRDPRRELTTIMGWPDLRSSFPTTCTLPMSTAK